MSSNFWLHLLVYFSPFFSLSSELSTQSWILNYMSSIESCGDDQKWVWIRLSVLGVDWVWLEVGSYNRGHKVGVREIKMAVRYPSSPLPHPPRVLLCKTKVSSYWASSTHPNGPYTQYSISSFSLLLKQSSQPLLILFIFKIIGSGDSYFATWQFKSDFISHWREARGGHWFPNGGQEPTFKSTLIGNLASFKSGSSTHPLASGSWAT